MERPAEPLVQRLLVCRYSRSISPELIDEVLDLLRTSLPAAERRTIQWALLRQAADLLEGSPWQRAGQLAAIIARWSGQPGDPIRTLLCDAARCGLRLPSTTEGIYKILLRTER